MLFLHFRDSALKADQEELRELEEKFRHEDDVKLAEERASRPQTAASQKTSADESQEKDEKDFDDEKALDEALAKVFELTGINNVEELLEKLTQTEELHFGLFSRIGELEVEAEKNEAKISDAEQELKKAQRGTINNDTQKQREVHAMEEKQREMEEKLLGVEVQHQAQLDTWNKMRSKILACHDELGLSV